MGWWKLRLRSGLQSSFAHDVLLSTVNKVLAEIARTCVSVQLPVSADLEARHLPQPSLLASLFIRDTGLYLLLARRESCGPSLQTRTRPAIEFDSGEEGPRPASSSLSSSILCVRGLRRLDLFTGSWPLLWGRGEMAERCSDRFGLCLRAAVLSVSSRLLKIFSSLVV